MHHAVVPNRIVSFDRCHLIVTSGAILLYTVFCVTCMRCVLLFCRGMIACLLTFHTESDVDSLILRSQRQLVLALVVI